MLLPRALPRRSALRRLGASGLAAALAAIGSRPTAAQDPAPEGCIPYLPDVVIDWFAAWEADDPPRAVAALYGPEGDHCDVPAGLCVGAGEIEGFVRARLAGLSLTRRHLRVSFGAGNWAAVDQLFQGTNEGFAPEAASGREFKVYTVTLFGIEGGKIDYTADYYDYATILRQLGAPAAPTGPAIGTPAAE